MSKVALFAYKCTDFYNPVSEASILWNDPDIGIEWPLKNPELSAKDADGLCLKDFSNRHLPAFDSELDEQKQTTFRRAAG